MSTRNIPFLNIQTENHPKLFQICSYGIFPKGLKNEFAKSRSKGAISVRDTEGLLYIVVYIKAKEARIGSTDATSMPCGLLNLL